MGDDVNETLALIRKADYCFDDEPDEDNWSHISVRGEAQRRGERMVATRGHWGIGALR